MNGSYYVQLEQLDWLPFGLSIAVGLLATAILVVNNVRDIETDRRAGKRTLAVRLGPGAAPRRSTSALVAAAYVVLPLTLAPTAGPGGPLLGSLGPARRAADAGRDDPDRRPGPQRRARRDGALLGVFSLLVSAGLADRGVSAHAIASVEVVPYALPFARAVRDGARDARRREMVLLRRARRRRPRGARRGGAADPARRRRPSRTSSRARERWRRAGRLDLRAGDGAASARHALSPPARCAASRSRCLDLPRSPRAAALAAARRRQPRPVDATRRSSAGRAAPGRRGGGALGRARLRDLQAEGRRAATTSAQVEAVRRRVGPDARIRVDANGAWDVGRGDARLAAMEPLRHRARRAAGRRRSRSWPRCGAATRSRSRPTRASRAAEDAERAAGLGACELATVKLAKVGGVGEARRIAAGPAGLPLERARRAGRDRRRGPRWPRRCGRRPGRRPRPRPRDPAPLRRDDRRRRVRARGRHAAPARRARASASRLDERRARPRTASSG